MRFKFLTFIQGIKHAWTLANRPEGPVNLTLEEQAKLDSAHVYVDENLDPTLQYIFALERIQDYFDILNDGDDEAPDEGMFG